MSKPYYLTTPIFYVNDVPHIGHAYTTLAADTLARWHRLRGRPVHFLTGTDEHGAKIARAAEERGESPQAYTDRISEEFRRLWSHLGVTFDDYIRTTEPRHITVVGEVFRRLMETGDIYLGAYEGLYCVPCESFWTDTEAAQGVCPTCGRPVERLKEESYFFRLSHYQERLLQHYAAHPEFLAPASRAPEIIRFVESGLRDLSVSRTRVPWAVPVTGHPPHTVYVWFDALINYISAVGFDQGSQWKTLWPADVHLVGKEIFRFHAVIWPAMLMALKVPLPRQVFAHGWWTVEGEKMSKSRGNVVDPHTVADTYGVDVLRYFLLKEVPFGGDGDFSLRALVGRNNAELANALGNLLNRTLTLLEKYNDGICPPGPAAFFEPRPQAWGDKLDLALEKLAFHDFLEEVFRLVHHDNKRMDDVAPWTLAKTDRAAAVAFLGETVGHLHWVALALACVMPQSMEAFWAQLGRQDSLAEAAKGFWASGVIPISPGQKVNRTGPLFPRRDLPRA